MKRNYFWKNKKWPNFKWDDSKVLPYLSQSRKIQGQLLAMVKEVGLNIQAEFITEDALKTSAIEGETLNPDSIRSSVAKRLGLPAAGLPLPQRSVDGLVEMLIDATQGYSEKLNKSRLLGWQAGLFPTGYSGIQKIQVGEWRTSSEAMRVISGRFGNEKIHYEAPPAKQIPKEMDSFLKWFNGKPKVDGLLRAAIAHLWFVSIHPFDDGNGRVARAITDLALAQDEATSKRCYSLSSQINIDRKSYYMVLESTQKGDLDITLWIIWFLQTFTRAIELALQSIERANLVGRFWQRHAHFNFNSRQRKALQKMLECEPGGFQGAMTNKKYVSLTRTTRESAKRDLADLEAKGIIQRNEGKGRSVSYSLVIGK